MHIPDGFLTLPVAAATGVAAAATAGYALRRAGRELGEAAVPVLGMTAAFIFAAQMLNFPILAGTSGHFMGGLAACLVLGPWNGVMVMTAVLLLQAFLMGDGGITALGANVLNMAVMGGLLPWALTRAARPLAKRSRTISFAVVGGAAWLGVVMAATGCSVQLALSGTVPITAVLPAMAGVHAVIGVGEALITVAILQAVLSSRPEMLRGYPPPTPGTTATQSSRRRTWQVSTAGLVLAVLLAVFVAPWASPQPDGLERVAEDQAFLYTANQQTAALAPLADYQVPALGGTPWSTSAAGLAGTVMLFALVTLLGRLLGRRAWRRSTGAGPDGS